MNLPRRPLLRHLALASPLLLALLLVAAAMAIALALPAPAHAAPVPPTDPVRGFFGPPGPGMPQHDDGNGLRNEDRLQAF